MKTFFALLSLVATVGCLALASAPISKSVDSVQAALSYEGDFVLGAKVDFSANSDEQSTDYVSVNLSDTTNNGTNFFVRLKNLTSEDVDLHLVVESVNGHGSTIKANGRYTLYDETGEIPQSYTSTSGEFFTLPKNFNGYFSITNYNLASQEGWPGNEGSEKDIKNLRALHFGVCGGLYAGVSIGIGDIFTTDIMNLDVSSLDEEAFLSTFVPMNDSPYVEITRLPETDFDANHDMNGGVLATVQYMSEDISSYWLIHPKDNNLSSTGIYFRLQNGWAYGYWIQFYILDGNGHRMMLGLKQNIYQYDNQGKNKEIKTSREFGSYFYIDGLFDGFIFIPYASLVDDSTWSGNQNAPTMDYTNVYSLIFGLSTKHDYSAQTMFGDIFTDNTTVFDGSEVGLDEIDTYFEADVYGNGNYINLSRLKGYKEETFLDYSNVKNYRETTITGGVQFNVTQGEEDVLPSFIIDYDFDFQNQIAIAIRLKNYSYDYPYKIVVKDDSGRQCSLEGEILGNVYYLDLNGKCVANDWGGNPIFAKIPIGFDGLMIIPFASLGGGTYLNLSKLTSLEFFVSSKYDYGFDVAFGEIGGIDKNLTFNSLLSPNDLTDEEWKNIYKLNEYAELGHITRVEEEVLCPMIGDTKILNSLIYDSDEEMANELLTDDADNPLTYERSPDGLLITPGEYEVGHANGPYSCLVLLNNSKYADRTTMQLSDGTLAKGLTLYVKNLSSREIGISLGFDQILEDNKIQRWTLIGYPSMYYAYDVNVDAEYTFYCKRDQFQIPVGFEGYIRIPFSSYGVPDWSSTNQPLDITSLSGNLYLSQDNRSYAGLQYLVKNVGVYFKTTAAASLFNEENTIKSNMGL